MRLPAVFIATGLIAGCFLISVSSEPKITTGHLTRQFCSPAALYYIVRDENGKVLSAQQLKTLQEHLPENIGDASVSTGEASFAPDNKTFYWEEAVEFNTGKRVPVLVFSNSATCTMHLTETTLEYQGKKMRLQFGFDIDRSGVARRPVVDSLPFQNGNFKLDLIGWIPTKDQLIPAQRWKRVGKP